MIMIFYRYYYNERTRENAMSLFQLLSKAEQKLIIKKSMPAFIKPMLAQLTEKRFGIGPAKVILSSFKVYYYVFDILYYDGYVLTHLPLLTRKKILKKLIPFKGHFRYVTHKKEKGIEYFKQAYKDKWEGLIAKK